MLSFQNIVNILINYWKKIGCILIYPLDLEVGAATSHFNTFFNSINDSPWYCIYVQLCRRPNDKFLFKTSNKLQKYYQLQVVLKPIPNNILNIYFNSLKKLKINFKCNKLSFMENNWENPSLGAIGFGWEILINNLEISQFTYFKEMGGILCKPMLVEITYGLERLCMFIQKKKNVFNVIWGRMFKNNFKYITYNDIYFYNELDNCLYSFDNFSIDFLFNMFNLIEFEIKRLINLKFIISSYELILKICHIFNLLDSKNTISFNEKIFFIKRIRFLSCLVANLYFKFINK